MHPSSNYLLVYDADCGPCRKFRGLVDYIDRYHRLDYISLREADELGLLNSIAPDQRHKSFHIVSPTGHVLSGSVAILSLLELFPLGSLYSSVVRSAPLGKR